MFQANITNFLAFKNFFKAHPNYRNHKIHLMAESYGAMYISMLAKLILQSEFEKNLEVSKIYNLQ